MATIYIGTSGWHYRHWRERFYPATLASAQWLQFYRAQLNSVEINNSFYRLLDADVVREWRTQVPRDFVFAVKGSRFITHNKKLKDPAEPLRRFMAPLKAFGAHLGPIVFQLPPHWGVNLERLEAFLRALPQRQRFSFEFRNGDWHNEAVYTLLRRHNVAFCIFQLAGFTTPFVTTADFVYVRLHGPGGKYQGSYHAQTLKAWARRALSWTDAGRDVYIYFDNDQAAHAVHNAITLRRYLCQK